MKTREHARFGLEAQNLRERRTKRPVVREELLANGTVGEEPAADTAKECLVQRPEHLTRVVKGEARHEDSSRSPTEELRKDHGGVTRRTRSCLRPSPHQLRVRPPSSLSENSSQDAQRAFTSDSVQPANDWPEKLEPFALERELRDREGHPPRHDGRSKPLHVHGGDGAQVHGALKNATASWPSVGTTSARSRYWLNRSHEHSGTNRQLWQAAPSRFRSSRPTGS